MFADLSLVGSLFLMARLGGGIYSVDSMMKKKE
jgi:hypothetical protein